MVVFIMLYKAVLTLESVDETLSMTIQMKATEHYFPFLLLGMANSLTKNSGLAKFQLS